MSRFWKRRHADPIETLLRANRAAPRDEYLAAMLARVESTRRRHDLRGLGRRLALAAAVTALAVGAAVAAGGMRSASSGVTSLVQVGKRTVWSAHGTRSVSRSSSGKQGKSERGGKGGSGERGGRGGYGGKGDHGRYPGDHQYKIAICHYTGNRDHPYVEIIVSPQGAAEHARHHPRDIVPAPPGGCPTKLPPEKHRHHERRHAGNQKGGGHEKGGRHGKHRG